MVQQGMFQLPFGVLCILTVVLVANFRIPLDKVRDFFMTLIVIARYHEEVKQRRL